MSAALLDGAAVARRSLEETRDRASAYRRSVGRSPRLAVVLVGGDAAAQADVRVRADRCHEVGIDAVRRDLPADSSTADVVAVVTALAADDAVDGVVVQHPLPAHVDERAVGAALAGGKDVDGAAPQRPGTESVGPEEAFGSCTPTGILALLDAYGVPIAGRHVLVVTRDARVGKPTARLLLGRDATVTVCHPGSRGLAQVVAEADIVLTAAGRPALIRGEWIKPRAVVVDAGPHPDDVGDVVFAMAAARASLITPALGGIGPMTVATLLAHTVRAAEARAS